MGMHIEIGAGTAVRSAMNVQIAAGLQLLVTFFYYYLQGCGICHFVITDTV